jgi:RNA polymerase sigma-70 factor (ECF subfamily)
LLTGDSSSETLTLTNIYEAFEDKLLRYAMSLVRDPHKADDLVQDTFVRAIAHLPLLGRLNQHKRFAWLRQVLKNRFIDEQRANQREQKMIQKYIQKDQTVETVHAPLLTHELLSMASEADRELLTQRYLLEMTSDEIGHQLGIPAATVRSRLYLARKRLRSIQSHMP